MAKRFALLMVGIALVLTAVMMGAQVSTSSITGRITDSTGAVIVGAQVQVKNEATGAVYQSVTTPTGSYVFPSLPPGPYTITVTQGGFRTVDIGRASCTEECR